VVADAEALPFADESFDGVVASNLLEHVAVPANVIREMRRVCKVGGRIYADWTSVHPYHGFPHHYFNATETGLEWLMGEVGGSTGAVTPADGKDTVRMVLEAWLRNLEDPVAREVVAGMSADELVKFLARPGQSPELHAALGNVSANGRRLIPPKVAFTGVRTR
jgi:ubiquinone/menaquinone biosynthesis C-methylase UbiE